MPGTDLGHGDPMGRRVRFGPFCHCAYILEEETDINQIIENIVNLWKVNEINLCVSTI